MLIQSLEQKTKLAMMTGHRDDKRLCGHLRVHPLVLYVSCDQGTGTDIHP